MDRRLTLFVAREVLREMLRVLARAFFDILSTWVSFALIALVQTAPALAAYYMLWTRWPHLVDELPWLVTLIPGLLLVYLTRILFSCTVERLDVFAKTTWGTSYRRRIPEAILSRQLRDTARELSSSFESAWWALELARAGFHRIRDRCRGTRAGSPAWTEAVCPTCKNLDPAQMHRVHTWSEFNMYYSDICCTAGTCTICSLLRAAVRRFYPPDRSDPFFRSWHSYRAYEEQIVVSWNHSKKACNVGRVWRGRSSLVGSIGSTGPDLTLYCLEGPPPDLLLLSHPKAAFQDTISEGTTHRIRSWIKTCTIKHEHCGRAEPKQLPDRVLEIQEGHGSDVRLLDTNAELGIYACLSHCWGTRQPLRTLASNKQAFVRGIPFDALPRTFQDAVVVCQKLGLRYIWIDSLCIVQDSAEDWQKQAAKMATIFENAFVTIAATKSRGHEEGLHSHQARPDQRRLERIPAAEIGHGLVADVYARLDHDRCPGPPGISHWDSEAGLSTAYAEWPLLTRAWVFQERLLSPRMLHFAKNELVWECRTGMFCDCWKDHDNNTDDLKFRRLVSLDSIKTRDVTPAELRNLWYSIVERYSAVLGNLTHESDAFPALSGLATRISGLLGDEYVAGLWRRNMVEGLLWAPKCAARQQNRTWRPSSWRAPTWSWASTSGEVAYVHNNARLSDLATEKLQEVYASVIDVECVRASTEITGSLTSATLVLSGQVLYGTIFQSERRSLHDSHDLDYEMELQIGGSVFSFVPDHLDNIVHGQKVACLRLARIGDEDWYIVLKGEASILGTFQRLGLLRGMDVSWSWISPNSWRRRAELRYREHKRVIRVI